MAPRKPRPDNCTRTEIEAMIAAAIQAERERSERAMAAVMQAIGGIALKLDMVGDALADAGRTLEIHTGLIGPLAESFAAALAMGADAVGDAAHPN